MSVGNKWHAHKYIQTVSAMSRSQFTLFILSKQSFKLFVKYFDRPHFNEWSMIIRFIDYFIYFCYWRSSIMHFLCDGMDFKIVFLHFYFHFNNQKIKIHFYLLCVELLAHIYYFARYVRPPISHYCNIPGNQNELFKWIDKIKNNNK